MVQAWAGELTWGRLRSPDLPEARPNSLDLKGLNNITPTGPLAQLPASPLLDGLGTRCLQTCLPLQARAGIMNVSWSTGPCLEILFSIIFKGVLSRFQTATFSGTLLRRCFYEPTLHMGKLRLRKAKSCAGGS